MKNNLKIRLIALFLCLVTLFFASCAPAMTPASSSGHHENGATPIVTKTMKLYRTEKEVQEILGAHYEGCPEILLMNTEI